MFNNEANLKQNFFRKKCYWLMQTCRNEGFFDITECHESLETACRFKFVHHHLLTSQIVHIDKQQTHRWWQCINVLKGIVKSDHTSTSVSRVPSLIVIFWQTKVSLNWGRAVIVVFLSYLNIPIIYIPLEVFKKEKKTSWFTKIVVLHSREYVWLKVAGPQTVDASEPQVWC